LVLLNSEDSAIDAHVMGVKAHAFGRFCRCVENHEAQLMGITEGCIVSW
jgi:hypothetical protein